MELFYSKTISFNNINKIKNEFLQQCNSRIILGRETNYKYDIFIKDHFIGIIEKNYLTDLIFNIEKNGNLGYSYKMELSCSTYGSNIKCNVLYEPQILLNRIESNEIYEFENSFFKNILQSINTSKVIDERWKEKSCYDDSIAKQPSKLNIKLFNYQLQSLKRMKDIEESKNTHILDTNRKLSEVFRIIDKNSESSKLFDKFLFDMYDCKINSNVTHNFYSSGGILADEMGLGKTITSIGLIIDKPYRYIHNNNEGTYKFETKPVRNIEGLVTKATLILCPSHLTKQWSSEITKANPKLIQILFLTKVNHEKYTYQDILDADVIIISFQFLFNINYYVNWAFYKDSSNTRWTKSYISDVNAIDRRCTQMRNIAKFNKKIINSLKYNVIFEAIFWNRIIIDEGHELFSGNYSFENIYLQNVLKNLQCNNKWYISGTPFYNIYSLTNVMDFLDFKTEIKSNDLKYIYNLSNSMNHGLSETNIVNSIFKQNYIRNTKESVKDQLTIPPANIENIMLEFSEFESTLYTSLKYTNEDYLRQICCNIQICDKFNNGDVNNILNFNEVKEKLISDNKEKIQKTQLSIDNLSSTAAGYIARKQMLENIIGSCKFLLNCFNTDIKVNCESCPICRCEFDDPVVTECGHNFCYECITEVLSIASYKQECPMCRAAIGASKIYKLEDKVDANKEDQIDELVYNYGTKIAKLIKLCNQILLEPSNKIIIFSEWDKLLSMAGTILKNNSINNVFCKGNVHQRNAAIGAFRSDLSKNRKNLDNIPRVIMLSTEHAASGTNLSEATHIIFMEPHKGEYGAVKSMEDQAIGRAVRLGQQNQVNVYRLIMKNTIEDEIMSKYLQGLDTNIKDNEQLTIDTSHDNHLAVDI